MKMSSFVENIPIFTKVMVRESFRKFCSAYDFGISLDLMLHFPIDVEQMDLTHKTLLNLRPGYFLPDVPKILEVNVRVIDILW